MASILTQERYNQYREMFCEDLNKCTDLRTFNETYAEIVHALEKEGDIREYCIEYGDG